MRASWCLAACPLYGCACLLGGWVVLGMGSLLVRCQGCIGYRPRRLLVTEPQACSCSFAAPPASHASCSSKARRSTAHPTDCPPPPFRRSQLPGPTTEWGAEAVQYLSQLLGGGREMSAKVVGRERGVAKDKHPRKALGCLQVVLKEEGASNTIAEEMLMGGWRGDTRPGSWACLHTWRWLCLRTWPYVWAARCDSCARPRLRRRDASPACAVTHGPWRSSCNPTAAILIPATRHTDTLPSPRSTPSRPGQSAQAAQGA